jgi:hypothetical protein
MAGGRGDLGEIVVARTGLSSASSRSAALARGSCLSRRTPMASESPAAAACGARWNKAAAGVAGGRNGTHRKYIPCSAPSRGR